MKKFRESVMLLCCLFMVLTNLTTVKAAEEHQIYNRNKAIAYAKEHWNDGEGVCDQFVKAVLKAGGIEMLTGGVGPLMDALIDAGYGEKIELKLDSTGNHINHTDNPRLEVGDPVFIYCEDCEKMLHTAVVGLFDDKGNAQVYGHNPAWDAENPIVWPGRFYHIDKDTGKEHRTGYKFYAVHMTNGTSEHIHNFKDKNKEGVVLFEKEHPHKMYAECSCGMKYYLGWNATQVSMCTICNPPLGPLPIVTVTKTEDDGAKISWSTVYEATGYNVYRSKGLDGTYFKICTNIQATYFTNKPESVEKGQGYYYKVEAIKSDGNVMSEATYFIIEDSSKYIKPIVSVDLFEGKPRLMWEVAPGIIRYEVYRANVKNGTYYNVFETNLGVYKHISAEEGKTYYYKVKAFYIDESVKESDIVSYTTPITEAPIEPEKPVVSATEGVTRLFGNSRYETAFKTADALKENLGVEKFNTAIIANGTNFADALAGSYLAAKKNAPILMTDKKTENIKNLQDYIKNNVKDGGTVYILGGTAALPENIEKNLSKYTVKRLAGSDRYETNLLILEEAGITNESILISTGNGFADSLSVSATGQPILLINKALNEKQKDFLENHKENEKYIIGGTAAVSATAEKQIKKYGKTTRLAGNSRYDTSVLVAETFFKNPTSAVIAYGQNFPDGLSGGPLAYAINSPLLLAENKQVKTIDKYAEKIGINSGYVLGGSGLISDASAKTIFNAKEVK